jgi:hypothetical protein
MMLLMSLTALAAAPSLPTAKKKPPARAVENFGIDLDKLHQGRRYALNGREVTAAEAKARLSSPSRAAIPDDSAKARLTVIGPPEATSPVRNDLVQHPALAPWREALLVQCYPPEHWAVARAGFVTTGRPTIYLQSPDGAVLHRQDDYAGGPVALAAALRRADPRYRPERDRDRRLPNLFPALPRVPLGVVGLVAAGVLLLLPRRSQP